MNHQWINIIRFFHESTLSLTEARASAEHAKPKSQRPACIEALQQAEGDDTRDDKSLSYSGLPAFGLLVADAPGLGKTTTAIMCGALALALSNAKGILVVVPPVLIPQWYNEVKGLFPSWTIVRYTHGMKESEFIAAERLGKPLLVLISKGTLPYMSKAVWTLDQAGSTPFDRSGDPSAAGWKVKDDKHPIFIRRWAALIADEAHEYRNPKTVGAIALAALGAVSRCRLLLTGTPLVNKLNDVAVQLKLAGGRPELHEPPESRVPSEVRDFYERAQRTSLVGHPKRMLGLPELRHTIVRIPMRKADEDVVRKAAINAKRVIGGSAVKQNILSAFTHLRLASTSSPLYTYARLGRKKTKELEQELTQAIVADNSPKMQIAVGIAVQAARADRKTVMFAQSIPLLRAMKVLLEDEHALGAGSAELFIGDTSMAARDNLVRRPKLGDAGGTMYSSPTLKVLLCSTRVAPPEQRGPVPAAGRNSGARRQRGTICNSMFGWDL